MSSLLLLQVTDTHLFASASDFKNDIYPFHSLELVLDVALHERNPDLVLATGDIAQEPIAETYSLFVELVRENYSGPLVAVPGNHDVGETMRKVLPTTCPAMNSWSIVTLDTHVDHEVAGLVSSEEFEALSMRLQEDHDHLLVVGHHPLADIGCAWLDAHRVANGDAIVGLLESCPATRAYLCGHIHQEYDRTHNGIRYLATPSTCWQFAPNTDSFGFDDSPPGWRWLELHDDGTIHTEVCRLH